MGRARRRAETGRAVSRSPAEHVAGRLGIVDQQGLAAEVLRPEDHLFEAVLRPDAEHVAAHLQKDAPAWHVLAA